MNRNSGRYYNQSNRRAQDNYRNQRKRGSRRGISNLDRKDIHFENEERKTNIDNNFRTRGLRAGFRGSFRPFRGSLRAQNGNTRALRGTSRGGMNSGLRGRGVRGRFRNGLFAGFRGRSFRGRGFRGRSFRGRSLRAGYNNRAIRSNFSGNRYNRGNRGGFRGQNTFALRGSRGYIRARAGYRGSVRGGFKKNINENAIAKEV